jgi:hypothetical protein
MSVVWALIFKPSFVGSKNVYLSATDDLSVTQSFEQKGAWVALDRGSVVGPLGGEVVSDDGKVKVVVPAAALSDFMGICISAVQPATLDGKEPEGTALLSAVDCKPQGLVFKKPVQLVYSLAAPEVPGTAIQLGLYDSVQGKIIPTGVVSTVKADGTTAICDIQHFSVYAALKDIAAQSVPLGSGIRVPVPDLLTGSFGHAIPIQVPPGRRGVQPALKVAYNSSSQNSWVGVGFSMNPGYIVRSTRLGPPTYDDIADTFYWVTDAGTTELVHLIDNLYQARIESSFAKFTKESDGSWKIVGKDGATIRLGQDAASREETAQGVFSWHMTRFQDTFGNYIVLRYAKDQGKCYLDTIEYAGHEPMGRAPTHVVLFVLEARPDVTTSYMSGERVVAAKRLKEISAKIGSDLVWKYSFVYETSPDTGRSLLSALTQCAGDGTCLPTQHFTYQRSK